MTVMTRRWLKLSGLVALVFAADQITKHLVLNSLALYETSRPIPALAPFFQLTRSENRGSAFGFLPQAGDIFLILAVVIVISMFFLFPRLPEKAVLSRIAFGLICGGAMGNAADRILHGVVIDFIHYTIPGLISNVSNIADHAIVVGVVLLLIESWRGDGDVLAKTNAPIEPVDEAQIRPDHQ
ncbi:MAG: signal peptidase II [Anaerolineae bacterium]|nr:signal peptidase II [Anaerolineae bacterium]